jgi:hypothetical protein
VRLICRLSSASSATLDLAAVSAAFTVCLATDNFGHPRHGQTCVDHLLDATRALRVAQVALLVVGDDLVHDAVDRLGAGICCRRGEDVDGNRGQTDFARRDGSTLPVPPPHRRGGESR